MTNQSNNAFSVALAITAGAACVAAAVMVRRARNQQVLEPWNDLRRDSLPDLDSDQSFPASDPPSFTSAHASH